MTIQLYGQDNSKIHKKSCDDGSFLKGEVMTTFERLAQRLKNDLGLDVDVSSFKRTYASKWMKSDGAFVWTVNNANKY